jgi:TRAP-type C4-dicarboxylate transport system substrate-binding protein
MENIEKILKKLIEYSYTAQSGNLPTQEDNYYLAIKDLKKDFKEVWKEAQKELIDKIDNLSSDDFNHSVNPNLDEVIEKIKNMVQ